MFWLYRLQVNYSFSISGFTTETPPEQGANDESQHAASLAITIELHLLGYNCLAQGTCMWQDRQEHKQGKGSETRWGPPFILETYTDCASRART